MFGSPSERFLSPDAVAENHFDDSFEEEDGGGNVKNALSADSTTTATESIDEEHENIGTTLSGDYQLRAEYGGLG